MKGEIAAAGLSLLVLAGASGLGFYSGKKVTDASWTIRWSESEVIANKRIAEIQEQERSHKAKVAALEAQLAQVETEYEKALADLAADYARRVQSSEARASTYRGWAEAGTSERERLADHAARLDAALTEGRELVKEFRISLGQCQRDLKALGQQINMDRSLIGEK